MKLSKYINRLTSLLILLMAGWAAGEASAQIVTSSPAPLMEDSQDVVIYYHADASEGSYGLYGLDPSEKVYAHIGVITDKSASSSDWKYVNMSWPAYASDPSANLSTNELTWISANTYSLYIGDIRSYFGITDADEHVLQIAMVFRNADGSLEGKTSNYDDIFLDVQPAGSTPATLNAPTLSPGSCTFFEPFYVSIWSNNDSAGTILYTLDGSTPTADNGLTYTTSILIEGKADVTLKAVEIGSNGETSLVTTATYTYIPSHVLTISGGNGVGYVYLSSNSVYKSGSSRISANVPDGESVYVEYSLNTGYNITGVTLNSEPLDVSRTYFHFTMPAKDTELVIQTMFDPSSPSDPEVQDPVKKYNLTLVTNPVGAGSAYGETAYEEGATAYVYAYNSSGYMFTGWTLNGETISTQGSMYYTMPASDVVLTANFVYNPSNPSDPEQPKLQHPLTGIASPAGSGSVWVSASRVTYGDTYYADASPRTGYKFKGWILNGVAQPGTSPEFTGVMTDAGAALVALFEFDPSSPSNPNANSWNPNTGVLILDDFRPGYLYSAANEMLGSSDFSGVGHLIVKGVMNNSDASTLIWFTQAGTIDFSRTTGINNIQGYLFENLPVLTVVLPATVGSISYNVFSGCTNLTSIVCHAAVPPRCESSTFSNFTNKGNCTVYVPAESVPLYEAADYWKDFTILPISDDAHVLQVNLPAECSDGRYKNSVLELVNTNTAARQRYVVTDRILYTFNGLQKDEQFNIYLKSQAGLEIGRVEGVLVPDHDFTVTLNGLREMRSIEAKVLTPEGDDVTSHSTVEWIKPLADGTTEYLRKANTLGEVPVGQELICRVTLGQEEAGLYTQPEELRFIVESGTAPFEVKLENLPEVTLSGRVVDGEGNPISGATVAAYQTLAGRYQKSASTKTANGAWELVMVRQPGIRVVYSAPECVNLNDTIKELASETATLDLGEVSLRSIVGARITYGFTYRAAGSEEISDNYGDYQNVSFSVTNITQGREHADLSVQYPELVVLDENVLPGDSLLVKAVSKTSAFNPIEKGLKVDEDQRAEITFDIVGKGGVNTSYEYTENPGVVAMLYNNDGELVKKNTYDNAQTSFAELSDGLYTLVAMGQSDLMNSVLRLSKFAEIGLTEGKDYVKGEVSVESGKISEVNFREIPAFDESLFYYTNSNTSFSFNKTSITTGNFLTLRSVIDFKGVYKNDVSNVALVVDLPVDCQLVENSVIQGPNQKPYVFDQNRVTVQLGNDYTSQTRFCVIPTKGGEFNATAYITFDYDGRTVTQPIGSAKATVKDIEINVPAVVAEPQFTVSGVTNPRADVSVYVNSELAGYGRSDALGNWSVKCALNNPVALETYNVYATVTTGEGTTLETEAKEFVYDNSYIMPRNVLMTFFNRWLNEKVDVNFNFETSVISPSSYMFYTATDLTFVADFTANSPESLKAVVLYVHLQDGKVDELPCSYDENLGKWIAVKNYGYGNLPVNMAIGYLPVGSSEMSFAGIDAEIEAVEVGIETLKAESEAAADFLFANLPDADTTSIDSVISLIESLDPESEADDTATVAAITDALDAQESELGEFEELSDIDAAIAAADEAYAAWVAEATADEWGELAAYGISSPDAFDFDVNGALEAIIAETGMRYTKKTLDSIDEEALVADGYKVISSQTGDKIYVKLSDNGASYIDSRTKMLVEMIIDENAKQNISRSRLNISFDDFKDITELLALLTVDGNNIKEAIFSRSDSDEPQTAVAKTRKVLEGIDSMCKHVQSLYSAAFLYIKTKAENLFNKAISQCDEVIGNQKLIKNTLVSHNKTYNFNIKSLNAINGNLQAEIDELFARIGAGGLSDDEVLALTDQISEKAKQMRTNKLDIAEYAESIKSNELKIKDAEQKLIKATDKKAWHVKLKNGFFNKLNKLPKGSLYGTTKLSKVTKVLGKCAGGLGVLVEIISYFDDVQVVLEEEREWLELLEAVANMLPCPDDHEAAITLVDNVIESLKTFEFMGSSVIVSEATAIGTDIFSLFQPETTLVTWFISGVCNAIGANTLYWGIERNYRELRGEYWVDMMELKCFRRTPGWHWPWPTPQPPFTPTVPIHDPSGYVYEAVPSNRVEGVQATIYYKETVEDMYGDLHEEVVLWDAEEYAQKNPLFTDANGMYQWDVPEGLWQVRFEKDGYVATQSEWLPVPPPQLDVNIAIKQNRQPEVTEARAYETGVEVQFDKYMDPETLNADNIFVTAAGEKLAGEIMLLDSEVSDPYLTEEQLEGAETFVSRVRFVPETPLSMSTGEVKLTVNRNVLSYAGIPMTETYTQTLDIEKEVQAIVADDAKVLYGGEKQITVFATPFDAAVGRTLHIENGSDMIATVAEHDVTFDDEGKAVITVKGEIPGQTQLTFSIPDVTVTGECLIDVMTEIITAEVPTASRASGTAVYRGTKLSLSTDSKNATIYFTTDGTCPCDENGTRRKYSVPIVITEDMHILAMTTVGNGEKDDEVSDIVEFNYTIMRSEVDYKLEQGWSWISHNFETPMTPAALAADANVSRVLSQTQEAVRDPEFGMIGTLTEMPASSSYKVETSDATANQRFSDYAWNPATPIALGQGWNWLGYPVNQTMTPDEAFGPTEVEENDVIVGLEGFAQYDGEKWVGTLETLQPGRGYMYQSQNAKDVVYNTSIVSNAASLHSPGISGNTRFAVDIHKYPSVMPVVAALENAEGVALDNAEYTLVAFSGSECRGIARLVEDKLMMNVYGNPGDEITFAILDADAEETLQNDAKTVFSENILGGIYEPYMLTLNSSNGIEGVSYDGNIRVYADGDMLRIKGIDPADIDLVEVYNLDGRKMIRETNVSESGIRISTLVNGAYVVIVNGNGQYTYHKIAIR